MYSIPDHLRPLNRRADVRTRLFIFCALLGWVLIALWVVSHRQPSLPQLLALVISGTAGIVACAPLTLQRLRGLYRLPQIRRLTQQGLEHLNAGEAAEALMVFEQASRLSQGFLPLWHAMSVHNVGVALLRAGEPERAVALIEQVWAAGAMDAYVLKRKRDALYAARSVAHAVAGQLDEAEHALMTAQTHRSKLHPGRLLFAEVLLAARQAAAPPVAELAAQWEQAERDLTPIQRRGTRLLLAFLHHRSQSPEATISLWLGGLMPMPAGALDYLAVRWPELHEFMQARRLLREQQPEEPGA
jgi:tetratricopeptide (TPR) repeat protein